MPKSLDEERARGDLNSVGARNYGPARHADSLEDVDVESVKVLEGKALRIGRRACTTLLGSFERCCLVEFYKPAPSRPSRGPIGTTG